MPRLKKDDISITAVIIRILKDAIENKREVRFNDGCLAFTSGGLLPSYDVMCKDVLPQLGQSLGYGLRTYHRANLTTAYAALAETGWLQFAGSGNYRIESRGAPGIRATESSQDSVGLVERTTGLLCEYLEEDPQGEIHAIISLTFLSEADSDSIRKCVDACKERTLHLTVLHLSPLSRLVLQSCAFRVVDERRILSTYASMLQLELNAAREALVASSRRLYSLSGTTSVVARFVEWPCNASWVSEAGVVLGFGHTLTESTTASTILRNPAIVDVQQRQMERSLATSQPLVPPVLANSYSDFVSVDVLRFAEAQLGSCGS